jgi:pimeloyl-ACP methyl ester carboxylesterase
MSTIDAGVYDPTCGLTERWARLPGVTLAYLEAGEGGEPLLLVHGFTGSKEDFAAEVLRLAGRGYHVVAPDHRGHGSSDQPQDESSYSFQTFANDMVALVDALGWQTFDLLGHSMGGMIVQHIALSHPHRVTRLILMDTHHGPVSGVDPSLVDLGVQMAHSDGMPAIAEIMKLGADPLANPVHAKMCEDIPGYQEWCDAKFLRASPYMFAAMLRSFTESADRLETLRGVACPTLVLVGELDAPFRGASQRMADTIADARLAIIPGAGHSPQLEAPDAWRAAIDDFLVIDPAA